MLRAVLDANVYEIAYVRPEGPPRQIVERFLRDAAIEGRASFVVRGDPDLLIRAHEGVRIVTPRAFLDLL